MTTKDGLLLSKEKKIELFYSKDLIASNFTNTCHVLCYLRYEPWHLIPIEVIGNIAVDVDGSHLVPIKFSPSLLWPVELLLQPLGNR